MSYQTDVEKYLMGNYDDVSETKARLLTTKHADIVRQGRDFTSNATWVADQIAQAEGDLNYHGRLDEAEDAAYVEDND